jgi:hypothetical protein
MKLIPMGIQHVIAMFGDRVAPILMGFDPQVTLFFSGVGCPPEKPQGTLIMGRPFSDGHLATG